MHMPKSGEYLATTVAVISAVIRHLRQEIKNSCIAKGGMDIIHNFIKLSEYSSKKLKVNNGT